MDQSNGTGGEMNFIQWGVGYFRTTLYFQQVMEGQSGIIDFQVNIYGEPPTANDFTEGHLTENSILLQKYVCIIS